MATSEGRCDPDRLAHDRSANVYRAVVAKLETDGHHSTADIARLMLGIGVALDPKLLTVGRWRVERGEPFDRVVTHGPGSYPFPLIARSPEAREVTSEAARCAAIAEVSDRLHRERWSKAAASLGIASRSPTDVLGPVRRLPKGGPPSRGGDNGQQRAR